MVLSVRKNVAVISEMFTFFTFMDTGLSSLTIVKAVTKENL